MPDRLVYSTDGGRVKLAEEIPQATNVVIMENDHTDMAPTYLQDKNGRNQSIAAFAKEVLDIANQVYESYYHVSLEQIPPQVTQSLLNYVSQQEYIVNLLLCVPPLPTFILSMEYN